MEKEMGTAKWKSKKKENLSANGSGLSLQSVTLGPQLFVQFSGCSKPRSVGGLLVLAVVWGHHTPGRLLPPA